MSTQIVTWNFPTRIHFGVGSIARIGQEAFALGARCALIVTDRGVVQAGLVTPVRESLEAAGVACHVFDGISSNPLEAEAAAAAQAYQQADAQLVIALGGGSALDVGKLVRLCATHTQPLADYDDAQGGSAKITGPVPPMIAVPTTAGTGSEVGRSAVVTLAASGRKTVIFSPKLLPDLAILDPALTRSMPAHITAATGFDALTHNVEAYLTHMEHPMADAIAREGITLVARHLATAVRDGTDLEARGGLLKASLMGAVAFQKGLGACHSLAHPLSSEAGLHHGLANALCLPAVLDFNRELVAEKVATVSSLLGAASEGSVDARAQACADQVRALRAQVGLPSGLSAVGIDAQDLPRLANLAYEDACHQENPRPCTRDDLLALYQASY